MINIPKGTKDALPSDTYKWQFVEEKARNVARIFGFKEIRTPIFEHTELFLRGVGDTTDIVNKEMYTFIDKGKRSITLKPEGTAGAARSFIENNLGEQNKPLKMYYFTPVFRYEQPQAGRLREHHQFGVELFGSESAYADAEVILLAKSFLESLGITQLELNINSIGCKTCRQNYNNALKNFLESQVENMCFSCKERFNKNPLRILDCKEENCKKITALAPKTLDYLCDDCKNHHETLKTALSSSNINFKENPNIVRGLDYYTRTVFEFISSSIGAQGTVAGGGRYNHLIEELGGKPTAAVGFGMGLERLIMVLESLNLFIGENQTPTLYIAFLSQNERLQAYSLATKLRELSVAVEVDLTDRSFKAQMKHANKIGAKFLIVLGDNEINSKKANLKNMQDGTEQQIDLTDLNSIKILLN